MGRIVVITGASSGIGLKTAEFFKNNGDTVINISKSASPVGDENYISDISNFSEISSIFQDIKNKFGRIDLLINNAGYGLSGITELLPLEECEKIFDVNFFGTLCCIQNALPLIPRGGKIINIGSAMALFPLPFRTMYGASKSAVVNFSYGLRMELKPMGIDVTVICPGNTKSNFTKNRVKQFETNERYNDRIQNATGKVDSGDNKRMPAETVAREIYKISNKRRTRPMKIVGHKYRLLYFASKFTPKSWLLNMTGRIYDGTRK